MQTFGTSVSVLVLMMAGIGWLCTDASSFQYSSFGDVEVYSNDTFWKCDHIFCPAETYRCHVLKSTSKENKTVLVRENYCYDRDNKVLLSKVENEPIGEGEKQTLHVNSYRNGISSSQHSTAVHTWGDPEVREKLLQDYNREAEQYEKIGEEVAENLHELNKSIQKQLEGISQQMQSMG